MMNLNENIRSLPKEELLEILLAQEKVIHALQTANQSLTADQPEKNSAFIN